MDWVFIICGFSNLNLINDNIFKLSEKNINLKDLEFKYLLSIVKNLHYNTLIYFSEEFNI